MYGAKQKTIKKVLRAKLEDWVKSVTEDQTEQRLILNNTIVTGGSICSLLMGDEVKDFDIYFKTYDVTEKIAKHYIKQSGAHIVFDEHYVDDKSRLRLKIAGGGVKVEDSEDEQIFDEDIVDEDHFDIEVKSDEVDHERRYRLQYISENAITLSHKIQIITRFIGNAEEIHKNFDFIHATCWYEYAEDDLILPKEALISMMQKTLYYSGSLYPICSLFRMKKFVERGWRISAGQILKMALQIQILDLGDRDVLREQLIGVDMAYFTMLMDAIDVGNLEDKGGFARVEYICEIIDRVFER